MLKFCNSYHTTVNVAIMYLQRNCVDGGDWIKKGWWVIGPGQCKVAYGGDLDDLNRYYCYFAEALDGSFWAGEIVRAVPPQRFEWCEHTASTDSRDVGFRVLDIGDSDNYTLTLIA
jgi:uncharacterized membrane protein